MKTFLYELHLATLAYHPLTPLVLSRGVDILPHQLAALYGDREEGHKCSSPIPHKVGGLLRSGFPVRILLADETGLGKTIISGLYLFSLLLRNLVHNVIIVVPKAVIGQWQDELLYKFGLYFKVVERGDEFLSLMNDVKREEGLQLIASIDLIKGKHGYEFISELPEGAIDLTIVDEAHHIITHKETLRFRIAKELAIKSKALILMSATPFRGYYEAEYKRILQLLGAHFLYIRRFKDQVTDLHGCPLFPKRVSYVVDIRPDPYWGQVYLKLNKLIDSLPLAQLAKLVLLKRLSSSLYALYTTLERLCAPESEDPFSEETDDVSGVEPDVKDRRRILYNSSHRTLQVLLDITRSILSQKDLTLKELELLKLLKTLTRRHKVVIFTEYRATLDRLAKVLRRADIKFVFVHGGMTIKERRNAITTFWNDSKIRVFLATDAAGEGINLQIAPYQINYDLPWSPLKLEQRFGRVHRYGQKYTTSVYNFAIKKTLDEYILNKVISKLNNIVKLLGDWVFDYVGIAIRPEEIRKLILEGHDVVDEEVMIKRLKALRAELHNPRHDNNYIYTELERLKSYIYKCVPKKSRPSVLEVLRISRIVTQRLNNSSRKYLKDLLAGVAIAVYKVGGRVISLWLLEKTKDGYLDPVNGIYVYNDARSYLTKRVEEIADFYGFKGGSVEMYGEQL